MTDWKILYRGSLTSCNYACGYCPFAKTSNSREELVRDAAEVNRFVEWVARQERSIGVLFTPWGEAAIHQHYQQAIVRLSTMAHVDRVSIQTNLSFKPTDFAAVNIDSFRPWVTFHPGEVDIHRFVDRCEQLDQRKIRYSVGVVGLREHFDSIEQLRALLNPGIYLWVNSYKRDPDYYSPNEVDRLRQVDPYFEINRHYYSSFGRACFAGESTFTIDGLGDARRCHFIAEKIGNIYEPDFASQLKPRTCSNQTCGCHIGYVHRPELELYELFGDDVLARIPEEWPQQNKKFQLVPQV